MVSKVERAIPPGVLGMTYIQNWEDGAARSLHPIGVRPPH